MELIRGIHNIKAQHHGCVLSIGNFDGVHLGHQQILQRLRIEGKKLGIPTVVMIFEPQPLEYFSADNVPPRLTSLRDKCRFITETGIDRLLCVKFNQKFASLSADEFVRELLVKKLGVKFLICGDDFRFGTKRQGDANLLKQMGSELHFTVIATESFLHNNEQRISSTAIRKALQNNQLSLVEELLGRPYSISGRVVHGNAIGRTIGFPTANIPMKRLVSPIKGVYAVEIKGYSESLLPLYGVANIGTRPTVAGKHVQLETNLFNFNGDLYGQHLEVIFRSKLRDEKKFSSLEELTLQIKQDVAAAQHYFEISSEFNFS